MVGGVNFPTGNEFRAHYKRKTYVGKVEDRALVVEGKRAVNPSSAANIITGNNVNGWRFWEAVFPDNRTGADSTSFERELLRSDFPRSVSLA